MIRLVRAELIKLATVPSTWLTAALTVAAAAGSAAIIAAHDGTEHWPQPLRLARIGLVVMGVIAFESDDQGRALRTALLAAPRRGVVLLAKAVAFALVAALTSAVTIIAVHAVSGDVASSALVGRGGGGALSSIGLHADNRAVASLVLSGLLGLGLAVLMRATIAPLVVLLVLFTVAPPLVESLGGNPALLPADAHLPVLAVWLATTWSLAHITFEARDA